MAPIASRFLAAAALSASAFAASPLSVGFAPSRVVTGDQLASFKVEPVFAKAAPAARQLLHTPDFHMATPDELEAVANAKLTIDCWTSDFEDGTLGNWSGKPPGTVEVVSSAIDLGFDYPIDPPTGSTKMARLVPGSRPGVWSKLSMNISSAYPIRFTYSVNFDSGDDTPFDDEASVTVFRRDPVTGFVSSADLFSQSSYTIPGMASTGWNDYDFNLTGGDYTLVFRVRDYIDPAFASALLVDNVRVCTARAPIQKVCSNYGFDYGILGAATGPLDPWKANLASSVAVVASAPELGNQPDVLSPFAASAGMVRLAPGSVAGRFTTLSLNVSSPDGPASFKYNLLFDSADESPFDDEAGVLAIKRDATTGAVLSTEEVAFVSAWDVSAAFGNTGWLSFAHNFSAGDYTFVFRVRDYIDPAYSSALLVDEVEACVQNKALNSPTPTVVPPMRTVSYDFCATGPNGPAAQGGLGPWVVEPRGAGPTASGGSGLVQVVSEHTDAGADVDAPMLFPPVLPNRPNCAMVALTGGSPVRHGWTSISMNYTSPVPVLLRYWALFDSGDELPFDDEAEVLAVRLNNDGTSEARVLYYVTIANVSTLYGHTGWQAKQHVIPAGNWTIVFRTRDFGDPAYHSTFLVDEVGLFALSEATGFWDFEESVLPDLWSASGGVSVPVGMSADAGYLDALAVSSTYTTLGGLRPISNPPNTIRAGRPASYAQQARLADLEGVAYTAMVPSYVASLKPKEQQWFETDSVVYAASSMEWYETAGTIIPPSNGQMLRITAPDAPKAWASASLSFASIVPTEFSYVTLFDSNDAPPFDDEAQLILTTLASDGASSTETSLWRMTLGELEDYGTSGWRSATHTIPAGNHTVTFRIRHYIDPAFASSLYVDAVSLVPSVITETQAEQAMALSAAFIAAEASAAGRTDRRLAAAAPAPAAVAAAPAVSAVRKVAAAAKPVGRAVPLFGKAPAAAPAAAVAFARVAVPAAAAKAPAAPAGAASSAGSVSATLALSGMPLSAASDDAVAIALRLALSCAADWPVELLRIDSAHDAAAPASVAVFGADVNGASGGACGSAPAALLASLRGSVNATSPFAGTTVVVAFTFAVPAGAAGAAAGRDLVSMLHGLQFDGGAALGESLAAAGFFESAAHVDGAIVPSAVHAEVTTVVDGAAPARAAPRAPAAAARASATASGAAPQPLPARVAAPVAVAAAVPVAGLPAVPAAPSVPAEAVATGTESWFNEAAAAEGASPAQSESAVPRASPAVIAGAAAGVLAVIAAVVAAVLRSRRAPLLPATASKAPARALTTSASSGALAAPLLAGAGAQPLSPRV